MSNILLKPMGNFVIDGKQNFWQINLSPHKPHRFFAEGTNKQSDLINL
jgi:hypothetical protein